MEKKEISKEKDTQLGLKIKDPLKNKFFKIKGKTDTYLTQLEVRRFLKDAFFWFVVVISITMAGYQVYLIVRNLDILPSLIPVLRYNLQSSGQLIHKNFVIIYPIFSFITLITSVILTSKSYNKDKTIIIDNITNFYCAFCYTYSIS
jgi:hypothetical protein